jgi:hypothetical protein
LYAVPTVDLLADESEDIVGVNQGWHFGMICLTTFAECGLRTER